MEEKENNKVILVEVVSLNDLIQIVAISPAPLISHVSMGGREVYMVATGLTTIIVYYFARTEPIKEKYIEFNRANGEILFKNTPDAYGGKVYIPIIHVKNQNMISADSLF